PVTLEIGKTIAGELGGKESAEYQFVLQKDQYAQVVVEQRSINIAIACFGPDGKELLAADTYIADEPETAELIAYASGTHRFRITPSYPNDPSGRYAITLRSVETATERHRSRAAAAQAYGRASKVASDTQSDPLRKAMPWYEEALKHWQAAGDPFEEARTLYTIGA